MAGPVAGQVWVGLWDGCVVGRVCSLCPLGLGVLPLLEEGRLCCWTRGRRGTHEGKEGEGVTTPCYYW
jgi:hypothetical protein